MPHSRLRAIWALVSMNGFLPLKRQPLFLLNTLTSPFSFLFLIFVVSGGNPTYVQFAVAGGMVLTVLSIGTSLQTDLTHYKQDLKFHEMAVASPISAGTYVMGLALSEFVYSLPGMIVFVVLSLKRTDANAFVLTRSSFVSPWGGALQTNRGRRFVIEAATG